METKYHSNLISIVLHLHFIPCHLIGWVTVMSLNALIGKWITIVHFLLVRRLVLCFSNTTAIEYQNPVLRTVIWVLSGIYSYISLESRRQHVAHSSNVIEVGLIQWLFVKLSTGMLDWVELNSSSLSLYIPFHVLMRGGVYFLTSCLWTCSCDFTANDIWVEMRGCQVQA